MTRICSVCGVAKAEVAIELILSNYTRATNTPVTVFYCDGCLASLQRAIVKVRGSKQDSEEPCRVVEFAIHIQPSDREVDTK